MDHRRRCTRRALRPGAAGRCLGAGSRVGASPLHAYGARALRARAIVTARTAAATSGVLHHAPPGAAVRPLAWSAAAFLGGVLLHLGRVPLWTILAAGLCAAWSLAGNARWVPLPGKSLRLVVALALVAAVLAMFHTLNGLDAGTALLTAMGSVKLLETATRRDRYVVIAAALYLLLAA